MYNGLSRRCSIISVQSSFSADVDTSFIVRLLLEGLAVRENGSIYKTANESDAAHAGRTKGTYAPPAIDITQAPRVITSECASTRGSANPVTTTEAVMKRPRSTGPDPSYSVEKSSPPQRAKRAFGSGARTKVKAVDMYALQTRPLAYQATRICNAPTSSGSQFDQSAHDSMTSRKPTASTKERRMTAGRRACVNAWRQSQIYEYELFMPALAMVERGRDRRGRGCTPKARGWTL